MASKLEGTLTVRRAKQIDSSFNINDAKTEALNEWTTPEKDYGYGYETAGFVRNATYSNEVYSLILDGELTETMYAIYTTGDTVSLEPTHWHEE